LRASLIAPVFEFTLSFVSSHRTSNFGLLTASPDPIPEGMGNELPNGINTPHKAYHGMVRDRLRTAISYDKRLGD
jgi:hypothetical protein